MMLIALSLGAAAMADLSQPSTAPAACQTLRIEKADGAVQRGLSPPVRNLNEEPPANEIKAVAYSEGGCLKPIVVRDRSGAPPAR